MQIDYKLEKEQLINNMNESFSDIYHYFEEIDFKTNDEYKKLNSTYYKLVAMHYQSFLILLHNNSFSSAIVLSRTILEVAVKSFYCELIEKQKNKKVENIFSQEYKFFEMLEQLDKYKDKSGAEFNGFFIQFSKKDLATYEKLSLFTHAKGEYIKAFYKHDGLTFTSKHIYEISNLIYKLFLSLSIFRLLVYGYFDKANYLIVKYKLHLIDRE